MPYGHPSQDNPRLNGNSETGIIATSAFAYTNVLLASDNFDQDGAGNPWTFNGVSVAEQFNDGPLPVGGYRIFGVGSGASANDNVEQVIPLAVAVQEQPITVSLYVLADPAAPSPSTQCRVEAVFTDGGSGDAVTYSIDVDPRSGQIITESLTSNFGPVDPTAINKKIQPYSEGAYTAYRINFSFITSQIPGADQITFRFYPDTTGGNFATLIFCGQVTVNPSTTNDGGPGTPLNYDTAIFDFPAYIPTYDAGERTFPGKFPFNALDKSLPFVETDRFGAAAEYFIDLYKDQGRVVQTSTQGTFVIPGNDQAANLIEKGWACFLSGNEDVFNLRLTNNGTHLQIVGGGTITGPATIEIPGDQTYIYRLVLIDPDNITWLLIPWTPGINNPNFAEFFDSSGSPYSFTWPAGVARILVTAVAAGGGGGGSSTLTDQPGGGGGGGESVKNYAYFANAGDIITITVGAGGNSGADGNPPTFGDNGTDTDISGGFSPFTLSGGGGGGEGDAAPGYGGDPGFLNGFDTGQGGQSAVLGLDGGASQLGFGGRIYDLDNGNVNGAIKGGGGYGAPGALSFGWGAGDGADGYVLFQW